MTRSTPLLALAALACLTSAPAVAEDVLDGWARRGSVYERIDMDGGTPLSCAALCESDQQCRAWVWTQSALTGSYDSCALLSSVPTAYPAPGQATGLSPALADRLDTAMDRPLSQRETLAIREVIRNRH